MSSPVRPVVCNPPHDGIHVVGAAIVRQHRCLAARRSPAMSPPRGCWEFPGGKVESGESPADALAREIREELRVDIEVGRSLGCSHTTTADGRHIVLEVLVAHLVDAAASPQPLEHDAVCWVDADALHDLDWAPADLPFLDDVCTLLAESD